jgi:hypothetical protein
MTRVRIPDFGGAGYGDDDYTPDDEGSPEMCSLCRDEPAAKSEQYYWGRLAVCPHCALRLGGLAARAVAAGARDEGGADPALEGAFRLLADAYWRAVGRPDTTVTDWLQKRLKSRGGPKEGGGP